MACTVKPLSLDRTKKSSSLTTEGSEYNLHGNRKGKVLGKVVYPKGGLLSGLVFHQGGLPSVDFYQGGLLSR